MQDINLRLFISWRCVLPDRAPIVTYVTCTVELTSSCCVSVCLRVCLFVSCCVCARIWSYCTLYEIFYDGLCCTMRCVTMWGCSCAHLLLVRVHKTKSGFLNSLQINQMRISDVSTKVGQSSFIGRVLLGLSPLSSPALRNSSYILIP
jgi:hypothetical protein